MIRRQASILSRDGDLVRVHIHQTPGCQACAQGRGCGFGLVGRLSNRPDIEFQVRSGAIPTARPGLNGTATLRASRLVQLTLLAYGLPLTGLLTGALAGTWLLGPSWQPLLALAGVGCAVLAGRKILRNRFPDTEDFLSLDFEHADNATDSG